MTDSQKYTANAIVAMSEVKTEEQLLDWHEAWMNSFTYLSLDEDDAHKLEQAYQRKAGWFMGAGAG
mgnify:CR=1 FL=1